MQIFTTRTDRVGIGSSGFTLIEILIVLAVIGVLSGVVVINFSGGDSRQLLAMQADRLARTIEMARHRSMIRNREWGLHITENGYYFSEHNPDLQEWIQLHEDRFQETSWPKGSSVYLQSELADNFFSDDQTNTPSILIFSSLEVTPFEISLTDSDLNIAWVIKGDGISKTSVSLRNG